MTHTWHYRTGTAWTGGTQGRLEADGKPALQVGTPPEFGGQPGVWTPEELLAGGGGLGGEPAGNCATSCLPCAARSAITPIRP